MNLPGGWHAARVQTGIEAEAATSPGPSRGRGRRRAYACWGLAAGLVALALLGEWDPDGWVVVAEMFDRWALLGTPACVLLVAGALMLRLSGRWARPRKLVLVGCCFLVAVIWAFGLLAQGLVGQHPHVTRRVPAPGDRPYSLVITEGSDVIDPLWVLSIRHGDGVLARNWPFACINGDAIGLKDVHWVDPGHVSVTLEEGPSTVVAVGTEGQPHGEASNWDGCQDGPQGL